MAGHRYALLRRLAAGGMAEVYLAKTRGIEDFEKIVALKLINQDLAYDPEFVSRFVREAKLGATLLHPNIVQTLELGMIEGRYFIAMEYVAGGNLATLAAKRRRAGESFNDAEVCAILRPLLQALGYAHDKRGADGQLLQLVHRDVSPQNVLLSREGIVKLTDFGIARAANSTVKTATGVVHGKLAYMAPEQANGEVIDGRADLYAAALVAYELLAGKLLRPDTLDTTGLKALREGVHAPITELLGHSMLAPVLQRALEPEPSARFRHAREFLSELERVTPTGPGEQLLARLASIHLSADIDESEQPTSWQQSKPILVPTLPSTAPMRRARWPLLLLVPLLFLPLLLLRHPQPQPRSEAPAPAPVVVVEPHLPAPPQPAPAVIKVAPGYLTVNAAPWALVSIDNDPRATQTPLLKQALKPGAHKVHLKNAALGVEKTVDVVIVSGKTVTKIIDMNE